jgi:hypothetical protein
MLHISICLCECYIEVIKYIANCLNVTSKLEKYQIVYVNVTSKLLDLVNCLCECYIKERQRYQIVYVNVTSKLLDISNCLCECYIKERQRYQVVYVSKLLDISN